MGVRATNTGSLPELKTIGIFSVAGREGRHLLGQKKWSKFPLFAAPFGYRSLCGGMDKQRRPQPSPFTLFLDGVLDNRFFFLDFHSRRRGL